MNTTGVQARFLFLVAFLLVLVSTLLPACGSSDDTSTGTWQPLSAVNAPLAKNFASAVWTGSEMIIWGGYDGTYLNSGGRYDPATDTWQTISTDGAPSARAGHMAVWTGAEMVVWGGFDGTSYLNTGGRYDPATDTWHSLTTVNAPGGRSGFTSVWTGAEMLVWGGFDGTYYLNTGGRYDPATDTWQESSTSEAPANRSNHTAVWSGTEMIVWGGCGDSDTGVGAWGGRYNPATDTWTATATPTTIGQRYGHTAVWTGNEMIIWGGYEYSGSCRKPIAGGSANTGSSYDPSTDSWQSISTVVAPSKRYYHVAVWTNTEMIIWGGADVGMPLSSGGEYSMANDTWSPSASTDIMNGGYSQTAVWTGTEMIVWGGGNNCGARYKPKKSAYAWPFY